MKKILLFFCLIIVLFSFTGCTLIDRFFGNILFDDDEEWEYGDIEEPWDGPSMEKNTTGKLYSTFYLTDSGVNVFKGIAPQGWYVDIYSNWNVVNHIHPGLETVVLYSPDQTAKITIISIHSYVENASYAEGVNYDYYTTYLHKMNATQYIGYYVDNNYPGAQYLEAKQVPGDIINQLDEYNKQQVAYGIQDMNSMNLQSYNMTGDIRNDGTTVAKEVYVQGTKYIELFTGVAATTTSLYSGYSSLLNNIQTNWEMPFLIIYEGDTKEDFDKYYDDYNFIVANSAFTTDFYAMNEYVSSVIDNQYTAYYAAKSQAALDATNAYIDSNYTSTSSESTQDKVRQMWSDVINEVDQYQLNDGSSLRTSMYNETVAQNGDEIYIGSKAGIPLGFSEVAKSY